MDTPVLSGGGVEAAVQFVQEHFDIELVVSGPMFKRFQVSNLAFIAFKTMAGKNLYGCGVLSDDIADNHIFGDHSRPHGVRAEKKGDAEAPPKAGLFQVFNRLFNAIHTLFDVLHADGVGETGIAIITKGNAGNQSYFGIFQQVGGKV